MGILNNLVVVLSLTVRFDNCAADLAHTTLSYQRGHQEAGFSATSLLYVK